METLKERFAKAVNSNLYEGDWKEEDFDYILQNTNEEYIKDFCDEFERIEEE